MCTNGRPIPELSDADIRRFWAKVALPDPDTGCMNWLAGKYSNGYGQFRLGGSKYLAHRISYTLAYGEIPQGMVLDHVVCRNKLCCNPEHLRVCSVQENNMALDGGGRKIAEAQRAKTHCPAGHAYSDENTYYAPPDARHPNGRRQCRACDRERQRNRRRAKRIAQSVELTA